MKGIGLTSIIFLSAILSACGGGSGGGSTESDAGIPSPENNNPARSSALEIIADSDSSSQILQYEIEANLAGNIVISGVCGNAEFVLVPGLNKVEIPVQYDGVYRECNAKFIPNSGDEIDYILPEITVDSTPPILEILSQPSDGEYISLANYQFSVNEISRFKFTGSCDSQYYSIQNGQSDFRADYLVDGEYFDCGIQVIDRLGNTSTILELNSFTIDTIPPEFDVETRIEPYINTDAVNLMVSVSESSTVSFFGDCSLLSATNVNEGVSSISLSELMDGFFHTCSALVTDRAGNQTQFNFPDFTVDNVAAVITEHSPIEKKSNSLVNNITFNISEPGRFTASGNCSVEPELVNERVKSLTIAVSASSLVTPESCSIEFLDLAGNQTSNISYSPFSVDVDKPILELVEGISGEIKTLRPSIKIFLNEAGILVANSDCPTITSNAEVESGSADIDFLTTEGSVYHGCELMIRDDHGNNSNILTLSQFRSDVTQPTLVVKEHVLEKNEKDDDLVLLVESSEVGSLVMSGSCALEETEVNAGLNTVILSSMDVGRYDDCRVQVSDLAGNESAFVDVNPFNVVPEPIQLTIWRGSSDSLIKADQDYPGYVLHRYRDRGCDIRYTEMCTSGQYSELNASEIYDTSYNSSHDAYFSIEATGSIISKEALLTQSTGVTTQPDSYTIVFNDVLISYDSTSPATYSTSNDGIYWSSNTERLAFGQLSGAQIVEFQGKLWLIGGRNVSTVSSSVWSSEDGVTWRFETDIKTRESNQIVSLGGRYDHQVVIYNNRLWLLGGTNASDDAMADVWSSVDGTNWSREYSFSPFGYRTNHKAIVSDDKIYVIGGESRISENHRDIWSFDGRDWVQENDSLAFGPRYGMDIHKFNGVWILAGGQNNESFPYDMTDIWHSNDLVQWTRSSTDAGFTSALDQQLFVFNKRIWLTGRDGIRFSDDGVTFKSVESNVPEFSSRTAHEAVSFNGYLWVIGGFDGESRNDIYRSVDGSVWEKVSEAAEFSARHGHSIDEYDGRLWLIGGNAKNTLLNDVWVSDDGISWEQVLQNAPFSGREGSMLVSTPDGLFLMGGDDINSFWGLKDVWKSENGSNWQLITDSAIYTQGFRPDAVYFNGKIIISDGINIYQANPSNAAAWVSSTRTGVSNYHNEMVVHEDSLYLHDYTSKVYTSLNGTDWNEADLSPGIAALQNMKMVSHGGYIWLLGGRFGVTNRYLSHVYRFDENDTWRQLNRRDIPFK